MSLCGTEPCWGAAPDSATSALATGLGWGCLPALPEAPLAPSACFYPPLFLRIQACC